MKKTIAILLIVASLLAFSGCDKSFPTVNDSFNVALCQGNTLASEQGEYLLMRGENNGNANLMLYHKKTGKAHILTEKAAYKVGLLENKVYYRILGEKNLYCLDLKTRESKLLQSDVQEYQVKGDFLYFIKNTPEPCFYKTDLTSGMTVSVKTDFVVNRFWLTDYGVYYFNEETQLLRVIASDQERVVYKGENEVLASLVSLGGADIAFLSVSGKKTTVKSYQAATRTVTTHLTGHFSVLNQVDGQLITADETKVYSIDPATATVTEKFQVPAYDYIEIMSDCVILYNGNQSAIRYY